MPKIHNTSQKQNIARYPVWTVDDSPTSDFFVISQLSDTLTPGKNAFLIHGSSFLKVGTEVKIELLDSNGNSVFIQPIKRYEEGFARLISIEIYENTPSGIATLTILGEATQSTTGQPVPDQWRGKYNVRWQKQINIDTSRQNSTPIRLYNKPVASVSEALMQWRPTTQPLTYVSGGATLQGSYLSNPGSAPYYTIQLSNITDPNVKFTRYGQTGTLTAIVNGQLFTSSIKSILNSTTAFLSSSYMSGSRPMAFTTTNFTMSFDAAPTYTTSSLLRSFAVIDLDKLKTFSGKIHRAKVFARTVDSTADYENIGDVLVTPKEYLVTQSSDGVLIYTGDVVNQNTIDSYWTSGLTSDSASYSG